MDENLRTIATDVDQYQPSLWHFIGQFRARFALMAVLDQYYNDRSKGRSPKYPVILLTGDGGWGRRTLARAFHEAMGNFEFKEPAHILGVSEEPVEFFQGAKEHTTFYIPNLSKICLTVIGQLIYVIRDGLCYKSEFPNPNSETIPMGNRLTIVSADRNESINPDIMKHVTVRCDLVGYSNPRIREILRQRVTGLNWSASDDTLELITQHSNTNPSKAMKILQLSYTVARSNQEDTIDLTHAKQALAVGS